MKSNTIMQKQAIHFEPTGNDTFNVTYLVELTDINPKMGTEQLEKIFQKQPYNFEAAVELANKYVAEKKYDKACEVRFRAASEAVEALPEDEEFFELEWEDEENQEFIEIIASSGTDFYVHGDFEMSAALFETALSLDPEDHLDIIPQLAISYLAIEDYEGYESVKDDLVSGSPAEALVDRFAAFMQKKSPSKKLPEELIAEIAAGNHEMDDAFFAKIERDRVSKSASARAVWFKHLSVFETFGEFADFCKR